MSLSERIAAQRAIDGDRTYAQARRDAAYGLGDRCTEAETFRTCPHNHLYVGERAYHRGGALPTSPFTRAALAGTLQGKAIR